MFSIEDNLAQVRKTIAEAAKRSGREAADITLVAVTKKHPIKEILKLKELGVTKLGESRVQELTDKFEAVKDHFEIHFIGHLQTNKAKQAVRMATLIHSIDSDRLLSAVNEAALELGKIQEILLQVNTSQEPQKGGVASDELLHLLERSLIFKNLRVTGLMTMAMMTDDREKARDCFKRLAELREKIRAENIPGVNLHHLSMGMSNDYDIAIEEGATLVRVGTALFEEKP